jgi:hypothetical protein
VKGSNYDVLLLRPRDIADVVDMSKAIDLVEQLPALDPYIAEDATDLVAIEIKDMPVPLKPAAEPGEFSPGHSTEALSVFRCPGPSPVVTALSGESRAQANALVVIHPKIGQSAKPKLIMSQRSRCRETQIEEPPVVPRRLQNVLRLSTVAPRSDRRSLKLGSTTYSGYQGRWRPGVTLSRRANFQKSGLSARGTAGVFPGYHWRFSAQTSSSRSLRARRNVTVADQGTVKAPSSSTVTWICSPLPL